MFKIILKAIIVFIFIQKAKFEIVTTDCEEATGCWKFPEKCQDSNCQILVKWVDSDNHTDFVLKFNLNKRVPIDSSWIGIAFSNDKIMGDDSAVICRRSQNQDSVAQYFTLFHERPILLFNRDPTIGLSNAKIETENDFFTCSFQRAKKVEQIRNYFDFDKSYFILAAFGEATPSDIRQHVFRAASSEMVKFVSTISEPQVPIIPTTAADPQHTESDTHTHSHSQSPYDSSRVKTKTHGCLMIIAWVLFASTGIILARFYKDSFGRIRPCGFEFWFAIHRPIMILALTLTLISFIVILAEMNWKWVHSSERLEFVHSIAGIIAIILACIQVVLAIFRCDINSPHRYIFNYAHSTIGLLAFTIAIIALFLGLSMDTFRLGANGFGTLLGWVIWIILFFISIEFTNYFIDKKNPTESQIKSVSANPNFYAFNIQENNQNTAIHILKIAFLLIHIILSGLFMTALVVLLALS